MHTRKYSIGITGFACVTILITLAHYLSVLNDFLLNAPDSDDYVDVLWFFEVFLGAEDILEKLSALFLPIHEHITVISHLIYLTDYFIFGKINFIHYIIVGQLIIAGICLVVARASVNRISWPLALMLSITIYYNLHYWHSSFWAMTAISNQAVILFGLLAALSLSKNPGDLRLPLLFATLGSFSQANGLAIFLAIAACLVVHAKQQKDLLPIKKILITLILFFLILVFHFIHQNPLNYLHHLDHQAMATEPELIHLYQRDISGTSGLQPHLIQGPMAFFALCGASFFEKHQYVAAAGVGIIPIASWIYFIFQAKTKPGLFILAALVFVLVSILLIAIVRGSYAWDIVSMQPRYRMYSSLLMLLTILQWLELKPTKIVFIPAMILALVIQVSSTGIRESAQKNYDMLTSSYYYWLIDGGFGRSTMPIYPPNQDRRLFIAWREGRYNPIAAIDPRHRPKAITALAQPLECAVNTPPADAAVTAYSKKPKAIAVEVTLGLPARIDNTTAPSLVLCGNEYSYTIALDAHNFNATQSAWYPLVILKSEVPAGEYRVTFQQGDSLNYLGDIGFK